MDRNSKQECEKLLEEFSAYLDGEASQALCAQIEQHLQECEQCRIVVDTMRQTITLYRRLPGPPLPAGVRERLFKALRLSA